MSKKIKLLWLIILIICFISIGILVKYNNQTLLNLDYYINIYSNSFQSPILDSLMIEITRVCNVPESILIFFFFGLFLLIKKEKCSFLILTTATTLGTLLPLIIKPFIERIRPVSSLLLETDYSFPSGHSTIATIFIISSIFLIAKTIKNRFTKNIFLLCTCIIFPLVIVSRVYLSVHWFSDVMAGILLGSICYILASFVCCLKKKNML